MARDDLGQLADRFFHFARQLARVAVRVQAHERENAQADLVPVDLGVIALDVSGLLERTNAAPARRRREADPLRKFCIREAAVGLQMVQDGDVELIECFHKPPI
jgi:hypothetical protein